jgi:hypothetical protein
VTEHWKLRWGVPLGAALVGLLARTWRIRVVGGERHEAVRRSGAGYVYVLWHGDMLPHLWHHRHTGAAIVISENRDGEIIARIAERLGYATIRGSTSRGAGRALLGMVRHLEGGGPIAVTPDGPRGPRHSFAPGALAAAQRAGAPLLLLGMHAARAWRFRSWDRFTIPKPFATVTISYEGPAHVAGGGTDAVADELPRFVALMDAAERTAAS